MTNNYKEIKKGIVCPYCGCHDTSCTGTHRENDRVLRYRRCVKCGRTSKTYEELSDEPVRVVARGADRKQPPKKKPAKKEPAKSVKKKSGPGPELAGKGAAARLMEELDKKEAAASSSE